MGYSDAWDALNRHVPEQYKLNRQITGSGQRRDVVIISELGLYALAMRSKLPSALEFQEWVYRVLSKIRQYGGYISSKLRQVVDIVPEQCRPMIKNMYDTMREQQTMINEMKPKVDYYNMAMDSNTAVPITVIAKDFGMSANELHTFLTKFKVIYRIADTWVLYKQYQGKGFTASKSTVTLHDQFGQAHTDVEIATYWTEKGRMFIYGILAANNYFPMYEL